MTELKIDKKKLLDKLEKVSFIKLAKYMGCTRSAIYYHYYNLKKDNRLTFQIDQVRKISRFLSDLDDLFFVN